MEETHYTLFRNTGKYKVYSTENGDWKITNGSKTLKTSSSKYEEHVKYFNSGYPVLHIIVVSDKCNQICKYCQASAKYGETIVGNINTNLTGKLVRFILENSNNKLRVEFQGGEPLLNFETIKYLVSEFKDVSNNLGKNVSFCLASNLTILTEEIAAFLAENSFSISVSLDGTPELHNYFRRLALGEDSYSKTIRGIKLLSSYGISPSVIAVTTKRSLNYPREIIDNFINLGIYHIYLKSVYPMGYAKKNWEHVGINPTSYGHFWKQAMERCLQHNMEGIPIIDGLFFTLLQKVRFAHNPHYVDLDSPCGAIHGQLAYDLEGNIYTCDEGRFDKIFCIGNVSESGFEEISRHQWAVLFQEASLINENKCGSCAYRPWCGRCPVLSFHECGDFNLPSSEYFYCQIMRSIFDAFFELMVERPEEINTALRIVSLNNILNTT